MKILKDILYKVRIESTQGGISTSVGVSKLSSNSKEVDSNGIFVAVKGTLHDGHNYIKSAIERGAVAVIYDDDSKISDIVEKVIFVKVRDARSALAQMASNWYDNPSEKLKLIGVTGTNGKTTLASMLYRLFKRMGNRAGLISTLDILIYEDKIPATHTTPDTLSINAYLHKMVAMGVTHCFMEVSSHGIDQKRIGGLRFAGGIFTNLTHDHLDYHGTFSRYRDTKKIFFDELPASAFALINIDDKNGPFMAQNTAARVYTYALRSDADYKSKVLENNFSGLCLSLGGVEVYSKLVGRFNAYNILAVYAASVLLGMDSSEVLREMSALDSVEGRFQYLLSEKNILGIVDYAHTPDALKNILQTIDELRTKNEKLITIMGCGGDRDKYKRPIMTQIAAEWSDIVILTSDNPRSESPEAILDDMEHGMSPGLYEKVRRITDRLEAIEMGCGMASPKDIVLVAGKGHENYQDIKGERFYFNDFENLKNALMS